MSKIQLNLLPDLKLGNIKAEGSRQKITQICFFVAAASLILFIFMLLWTQGVQKKQLSDADSKIKSTTKEIQKTPDLDKILTIQNQLQTLSTLHQGKHLSSNLFSYLPSITPSSVQINQLALDINATTMQISGTAANIQSVNAFVDTLKVATFTVGSDTSSKPAFSNVIENGYSIASGNVNYSVGLKFDPSLFTNILDAQGKVVVPKITVPSQVTNRSNDPSSVLFGGTKQ